MGVWLAILLRLLVVGTLLLSRTTKQNEILRTLQFCEVYGRSTTCTTWIVGAMETAGYLIRECHTAYPPPQDIPFQICLEEFGF